MKTSVNPPIGYPELDLGAFSYGLAHEAINSDTYRERLKKISQSGRYLILDNGADELGSGLKGDSYYDLIAEVEPNEVIAPDVLGDAKETRERFEEFYPWFEEYRTQAEGPVPKLMAVVQAQSYPEWVNEYEHYMNDKRVDVIGVPYDIGFDTPNVEGLEDFLDLGDHISHTWSKNRVSLLSHLWKFGKEIHLLGMSTLQELYYYTIYSRSFTHIRSNDTTAPFAAAIVGDEREWDEGESGSKDWNSLDFNTTNLNVDKSLELLNIYFHTTRDRDGIKNFRLHTREHEHA